MQTYELHATAKQVQRSSGRSSVSAAAYRSGERLVDERTGELHDYTRKQGIEHSRIYAPEDAPDWATDRARLWNAVEARETRGNSATAHELEVGFPAQFDPMQRREAGDAIAREIMRRYNVAVDINYHQPSRQGDQRNFHAHITFTTRGFDASRPDGWARTKFRDLAHDPKDKKTGEKYLDQDGKATTRGKLEVEALRKFSADEMNRIAERDRLNVRTEYLSFERRGIDREPTQKRGPHATEMEREGKASNRGDVNREIQAANDNRRLLVEQMNVIVLDQERTKQDYTRLQREAMVAHVASQHRFHEFHKQNVERAEKDVQAARARFERLTWLDTLRGTRKQLQTDLEGKQAHLDDARQRMHELVDSKTRAEIERGDYAPLLRDQQRRMLGELEVQRAERLQVQERERSEYQAIEFERASRTNAERVLDAVSGKSRAQELRMELLRENAKAHQEQERQYQSFMTQERSERVAELERELQREHEARRREPTLEEREQAHFAGSRAPVDSREYQAFAQREQHHDRARSGEFRGVVDNYTFWSGVDRPPSAHGHRTETELQAERMAARQAQFDDVYGQQGRAANDDHLSPTRADGEATAEQREFDQAAERIQSREQHAAGERVADASHGFDGGKGGGTQDSRDEPEWER